MVELIIDNRENIKELLLESVPDAKFENLEIGDYVFKIDEKPFLIIERKTITDYAASIVDSRSREQKKRMQKRANACRRMPSKVPFSVTNSCLFT